MAAPYKTSKNGLPIYKGVAPSYLKNAPACELRWAAKAVFRMPEPPNKYAKFGIDGHAVLENYWRTGVKPKGQNAVERAALAALTVMPPREVVLRGQAHYIEEWLTYEDPNGYAISGPSDLVTVTQSGNVDLWDYKFVGSLKYKMSGKALEKDAQPNAYALALMDRFNVDQVTLHWVYICRKANEDGTHSATVVCRTIGRDETRANWAEKWDPIARRLIELHGIDNPTLDMFSYDETGKACWMFGVECPHKRACDIVKEKKMSLEDSALFNDIFGDDAGEFKTPDDLATDPTPADEDPINPPESPKKTGEAIGEPDPPKASKEPKEPAGKSKPKADKPKRGRGRPKKEPKDPADTAEPKDLKPTPPKFGYDLVLFGNVIKGGDTMLLHDIMRPVIDSVEGQHGVTHWREIKYGGHSEMASACRAAIQRGDFAGQTILCPHRDALVDACLSELIAGAVLVVSGGK